MSSARHYRNQVPTSLAFTSHTALAASVEKRRTRPFISSATSTANSRHARDIPHSTSSTHSQARMLTPGSRQASSSNRPGYAYQFLRPWTFQRLQASCQRSNATWLERDSCFTMLPIFGTTRALPDVQPRRLDRSFRAPHAGRPLLAVLMGLLDWGVAKHKYGLSFAFRPVVSSFLISSHHTPPYSLVLLSKPCCAAPLTLLVGFLRLVCA